jgi:hypothetical protein
MVHLLANLQATERIEIKLKIVPGILVLSTLFSANEKIYIPDIIEKSGTDSELCQNLSGAF